MHPTKVDIVLSHNSELVVVNDENNKGNKDDGSLQLSPISVKEDYRKKWNIHSSDFVCLTKNGKLISDSLYRVGMFEDHIKDTYFLLLKYYEAFYADDITKIKKDKPHLEGRWCILNQDGIEKVEFSTLKSPYLVKDSCIYSLDRGYYNIETGEFYGDGYTSMKSKDFLFIDNQFDKDESKRGVKKINKKDGTWELFPEK